MPVERPPALEIADEGGGGSHERWTTPKMLIPHSPYDSDGLRDKPAPVKSRARSTHVAGAERTVDALLDLGVEIPRTVVIKIPGTPTAVRVTVNHGGSKRRAAVNDAGVKLIARWNRRRSLAVVEDGEFTLMDDLRRQFMANEDDSGENWELYSDQNLLMRESLKFDPRVRAILWKIWVRHSKRFTSATIGLPHHNLIHRSAALLLPASKNAKTNLVFTRANLASLCPARRFYTMPTATGPSTMTSMWRPTASCSAAFWMTSMQKRKHTTHPPQATCSVLLATLIICCF